MQRSRNHFELFGVPQRFELSQTDLAARYRDLQSQLHPDRYVAAGATERRLAAQGAAEVNEAFQTLKDPLRRAQYLLALAGLDGSSGESDTTADSVFLMQQIEWREALDEAPRAPDPQARLSQLAEELRAESCSLEQSFARHYQDGEWAVARVAAQKMQFFRRLLEDVRRREDALDDSALV